MVFSGWQGSAGYQLIFYKMQTTGMAAETSWSYQKLLWMSKAIYSYLE
jgi:hypothetical protein